MPQIISAISGMKLESGFAYLCSKPQPDIGRTLQTHIHDSTEILFLVSFTAPGWTIATRSTNVMQIRCVAMPPLHRYTHTDPHTHTADSCGHGSSNSGWKRLYCPCINGFKRGLRATVYSITSSIFPSLPFCQRQEISVLGPNKLGIFTHLKHRNWHNCVSTWGPRWNPGHKTGQGFL